MVHFNRIKKSAEVGGAHSSDRGWGTDLLLYGGDEEVNSLHRVLRQAFEHGGEKLCRSEVRKSYL